MTIRIPDFLFAQSSGHVAAPGGPDEETRRALADTRSAVEEMSALSRGIGLAGEALNGGDQATAKLAAARKALGARAESGAFRLLFDRAAAAQAHRETTASQQRAMRSLIDTIKGVGGMPISFAEKAQIGRTLLQAGIARGLLRPEQLADFEPAMLSQFGLGEAASAVAGAVEPGEALAVLAAAQNDGALLPMDLALLERQARDQDAAATARHRGRLTMKEQDDLAAFARGEQPEPLSEESFRLIHGARGATGAHARYQAARRGAEVLALIRGRDADDVEAVRAGWQGDPAVFDAAVAKDAADRARDPAGYALATVPGAAAAYELAAEAERSAMLWAAQAAAGIPEDQRSPWTLAEEEAMADEWAALSIHPHGIRGKLDFFRRYVLGLPAAQREVGIARIVKSSIADGGAAQLTELLALLDARQVNSATRLVGALPLLIEASAGESYERVSSDHLVPARALSPEVRAEGDGPEVTAVDPEVAKDQLAPARARKEVVEAVAKVRHPHDLPLLIPRIREAYAGNPAAQALLEAKAREFAHNPPLPEGQGGGAFPPGFADWAAEVGYYRDSRLVAAGENVRAAGYEVLVQDGDGIGVALRGKGELLVLLDSEDTANRNLSDARDRALFKLALDTVSQARPIDEIIAEAEAADPTVSTTYLHPKLGRVERTAPSEAAEVIRLADEAVANGGDPGEVAAVLLAALFPPSDWESAAELVIALSPLGIVQDAAEVASDVAVLFSSKDEEELSRAWKNLLITAGSYAAGALGVGVARIVRGSRALARSALKTLADVRSLKRKELVRMAETFERNAIEDPRVGVKIDKVLGDRIWSSLGTTARKSIAGESRRLFGGLAEDVGFAAAEAKLQTGGMTLVGRNVPLKYNGRKLNIDIVAQREGAAAVAPDGLNTVQIGDLHYRLTDLEFIDVKFGSSRLTRPQKRAQEASEGRFAITEYKVRLNDLPPESLVDWLNASRHMRNANPPVVFTVDMVQRYAGIGTKDATFEGSLHLLLIAALALSHATNRLTQQQEGP